MTASSDVLRLGVLCGLATLASCAAPSPAPLERVDNVLMTIADPRVRESSGLAASARHPGIYYTHNDRGGGPEVFALNEEGDVVAVLTLAGAPAVDWEDMAVTPSGDVWVGDIGGNSAPRSTISVLRFSEPTELADGVVDWEAHRMSYQDGSHDAEALLVNPRDQRVYVVTKQTRAGGIYVAPRRLGPENNVLRYLAESPANITGGSFAPDGPGFVLRNHRTAYVYEDLDDLTPQQVPLPQATQGESIAMLPDGVLLVGSEGAESEVVRVSVPPRD